MLLAAWYHLILATIFSMLALLLLLVILLQRGKGVGLSGAFGAAGGHTALGSKTGDVLTWVTMVGAGVFLFLTVILTYFFQPISTTPPPAATPAGTTPADGGAPTDGGTTGGNPGGTTGGQGPTPSIEEAALVPDFADFRPLLWTDVARVDA